MTQDHSGEETDQTNTAEGNVIDSAPVAAETHDTGAHDVESAHGTDDGHDVHDAHDAHDDHDGHDAHGDDGDAASEKSTLVPVTWHQLIFPALILILVIILLIGPVGNAFAPHPASSTGLQAVPSVQPTGTTAPAPTTAPTTAPSTLITPTTSGARPQATSINAQKPANTIAASPTAVAAQPVQPTAIVTNPDEVSPSAAATRTAVAVQGESGTVARAPVQLQFEGAIFTVDAADSGVLPDWKPSGDATHATWIAGTFANHIIYLPYSDSNAALFSKVKEGDTVKLTMNTDQVFEFQVTRSERASNGPPTTDGQFTVTTAMSQDHAGVTIFLVGDPSPDRAVVQADFNGNIE